MRAAASNTAEAGSGLRELVLDALATVYDPELDEPITTLRFVTSCDVTAAGDVEVVLRLPTPQCAPNFAFLMAADAMRAVGRLPGVRAVDVRLEDHYTGGGFPRVFYLRYHGYAKFFPLWALARYRRLKNGNARRPSEGL